MTVWRIVIHEVQTYSAFRIVDKRCTSLGLRLHCCNFCADGTRPVGDGIHVQRRGSSVLSDGVLVDFLRNEAAAIAAPIVVDVIDQSRAFFKDDMASWAQNLLRFDVVLFV